MNATRTVPTISPTPAQQPSRVRVWDAALRAGATAAIATETYALLARAAHVSMRAGQLGATTAETIPPGSFAMGTLICTFWGTVVAAVLARRARRPRHSFTIIAVALTVASFVTPLGAGATSAATKLMLCGAHLLAAAIVIPTLRRRLPAEVQR